MKINKLFTLFSLYIINCDSFFINNQNYNQNYNRNYNKNYNQYKNKRFYERVKERVNKTNKIAVDFKNNYLELIAKSTNNSTNLINKELNNYIDSLTNDNRQNKKTNRRYRIVEERNRRYIEIDRSSLFNDNLYNNTHNENNDNNAGNYTNDDYDNSYDDLFGIPIRRSIKNIMRRRSEEPIRSSEGNFEIVNLNNSINFTSIGGYKEVKEELKQVIEFLVSPEKYHKYGVRIPRGLLLEGSPGNGKTLLAKGLAGEANTSFIATAGSTFNEKYVGVGAARVRELFNLANNNLPCIIFIDELDALAKKRNGNGEGSDSERDQTLNQLLVLMDGFTNKGSLLIVGATNRIDILDAAIIRPGRFDKIINVPNPDSETREEIIKIHIKDKPIDVDLSEFVKITNGFSGAQIENLINEAVLYGIRNDSLPVTLEILDIFKDRIMFGQTTKKKRLSDSALKRIAIHEVGHLLMGLNSKYIEKPEKISIDTSNIATLGYTMFEINDIDEGLYLREYLEDKLKLLLGGRVAEEVVYGMSVSSGALSDLENSFNMARAMIMQYGMGDKIIYPYFSEQYKKEIDDEIHILINAAYKETKKALESYKLLLLKLSDRLIEKKVMSFKDITDFIVHFQNTYIKDGTNISI